MKQQVNPTLVIGIVVALLLILGIAAWRMFGNNPAGGSSPTSAAQAGLGKPMYPASANQSANNAGQSAPGSR
jgi:hypothetical protein